jgi:hypothetical protein
MLKICIILWSISLGSGFALMLWIYDESGPSVTQPLCVCVLWCTVYFIRYCVQLLGAQRFATGHVLLNNASLWTAMLCSSSLLYCSDFIILHLN